MFYFMKVILHAISILFLIFCVFALFFLVKHIVHVTKQTHIKAEFTELTPFSRKMPVYFKGFKIGKITKIIPKDDFTTTLMDVTLFPEQMSFPENIYLQVRSYKRNLTYAEIMLPDEPSVKKLKDGTIIQGKTNMSFESILERQSENGSFDLIITTAGEMIVNANKAIQELNGLLSDIRTTFKNNESYISVTTRNISTATSHLNRTTFNISSTVDQKSLDKTMKNVEETSKNLKNITRSVDCATRNLTETMEHINQITANVSGITESIDCTMKDRFGGFRLFFGKPSKKCKCNK